MGSRGVQTNSEQAPPTAEKAAFRGARVILFKYLRIGKTWSLTNQFCRKLSGIHCNYFAHLHFSTGRHTYQGPVIGRIGGYRVSLFKQHPMRMAEPCAMYSKNIAIRR